MVVALRRQAHRVDPKGACASSSASNRPACQTILVLAMVEPKGFQSQYAVLRLSQLRPALLQSGFRLFMLCSRRSHLRFRQDHLRVRLIHRLLSRCNCCPGLIYLVYRDKLFGKQRFDAMEIVGRILQFCFCTIQSGLGAGHIGLCLVDGCRCMIDIRSSTVIFARAAPTALCCDAIVRSGPQSGPRVCSDRIALAAKHIHKAAGRSRRAVHPA